MNQTKHEKKKRVGTNWRKRYLNLKKATPPYIERELEPLKKELEETKKKLEEQYAIAYGQKCRVAQMVNPLREAIATLKRLDLESKVSDVKSLLAARLNLEDLCHHLAHINKQDGESIQWGERMAVGVAEAAVNKGDLVKVNLNGLLSPADGVKVYRSMGAM